MLCLMTTFLTPKAHQLVYVIVAIASWYYPNPDVATSNGVEVAKQVTISAELVKQMQRYLQQHDEL